MHASASDKVLRLTEVLRIITIYEPTVSHGSSSPLNVDRCPRAHGDVDRHLLYRLPLTALVQGRSLVKSTGRYRCSTMKQ